jgi:hypothetical protein
VTHRSEYVFVKLNPIICLIVDSLMEEEGELGLVEKGRSISEGVKSFKDGSKEEEGGSKENSGEGHRMGGNRGNQGKTPLDFYKGED